MPPAVQLYLHSRGTVNEQGGYEHERERDKIQLLKVAHAHFVCYGLMGRGKEIGSDHHIVSLRKQRIRLSWPSLYFCRPKRRRGTKLRQSLDCSSARLHQPLRSKTRLQHKNIDFGIIARSCAP